MAKKKNQARRVPRAADAWKYGDGKPSAAAQATGQTGQPAPTPSRGAATQPVRPAGSAMRVSNLQQDYNYVLSDLRRLGILAVSVFAVLVVLGLVIR